MKYTASCCQRPYNFMRRVKFELEQPILTNHKSFTGHSHIINNRIVLIVQPTTNNNLCQIRVYLYCANDKCDAVKNLPLQNRRFCVQNSYILTLCYGLLCMKYSETHPQDLLNLRLRDLTKHRKTHLLVIDSRGIIY